MDILHDYELMPPLYRDVYYGARFKSGTELHKFVSKVVKAIEKKKGNGSLIQELTGERIQYIEKGVPESEMDLIKSLLQFKYNDTDIHPKYDDFNKYINKTKKTTTVEMRKEIKNVVHKTEFIHAHSKEEVGKIKALLKTINLEEIMEEIDFLVREEENRILTYQKEAAKRKRNGSRINKMLSEIAPKIIEEVKQKNNFFSKLKFNKKKIGFFINPGVGKDWEILNECLKKAKKSERIMIELDDENENYCVSFSSENLNDLAFIRHCLVPGFMKSPLEGLVILGIPIQVIIQNCRYDEMPICETQWHELTFYTYYESIKNGVFAFKNQFKLKGYHEDSIRYVINELLQMTKFDSELHLACYLHYNYLLPLQVYANKREQYFKTNQIEMSLDEFKEKKEEIYKQLVLSGTASITWKNEMELYKLVAKYYPDAIYQYYSLWLERKSLDIYIPSLKIGIEYQGKQHYEPVIILEEKKHFYIAKN